MLDVIKRLVGAGKVHKETSDLQLLITEARAERDALATALEQFAERQAMVTALDEALTRLDDRSCESSRVLGMLAARTDELETQTLALRGIEARIQRVDETAGHAQQLLDELIAPDGKLEVHRRECQELVTEAHDAQQIVATLKSDRTQIEELRAAVSASRDDVERASAEAASVRAAIESVRQQAEDLGVEYTRLSEASLGARENAAAAAASVLDAEQKLEPLLRVHELTTSTEDRFAQLNALAEHVTQKTKALEGQKQTLDRAIIEANRLDQMVWTMDVQLGRLREGLKEAERVQETVAHIEGLAKETEQTVDVALKMRNELTRDVERFERDGQTLVQSLRSSLESLNLERQGLEALDARAAALRGELGHAETRISVLDAKTAGLAQLQQDADALARRFETLSTQSDQMVEKQTALESLHERLTIVDDLAKQTSFRYDSLRQSRADLETLRRDVHELHKSTQEASQLRDRLAADRSALEAFGNRMGDFRAQVPLIEAEMAQLLERLAQMEAATKQATRLESMATQLDIQASRLATRQPFVESLDARLNALHLVSLDVDRRMTEQLARRAELDAVRALADGAMAQMSDAQHKLDVVTARQQEIQPFDDRLQSMREELDATAEQLRTVRQDEATIVEQRSRLEALLEENRALSTRTDQKLAEVQALSESLERSVTIRNELMVELSGIEKRQRDVIAQIETTGAQIKQVEGLVHSVDERRGQMVVTEMKLSSVEQRLGALDAATQAIDEKMRGLAERDAIVTGVRQSVDAVSAVSAKSRADLEYVTAHREDVAAVRERLDALLAAAGHAEEKIVAIEGRRKAIDAVQVQANLITNLLEDLRLNLETLGEQKAVVEHVSVKLARLEFVMQEAQNTLRALQHERELAERIEQNIAQIRTRTTVGQDGKNVAAV